MHHIHRFKSADWTGIYDNHSTPYSLGKYQRPISCHLGLSRVKTVFILEGLWSGGQWWLICWLKRTWLIELLESYHKIIPEMRCIVWDQPIYNIISVLAEIRNQLGRHFSLGTKSKCLNANICVSENELRTTCLVC